MHGKREQGGAAGTHRKAFLPEVRGCIKATHGVAFPGNWAKQIRLTAGGHTVRGRRNTRTNFASFNLIRWIRRELPRASHMDIMQQTPSTPDAVKLDIGPVAEESKGEAHRPTRVRSISSISEVRHGHRIPAAPRRDSDRQPLPGRHTCSLPPWCEA